MKALVAAIKPWNIQQYVVRGGYGAWRNVSMVNSPEELIMIDQGGDLPPGSIIFFPHWSWKVPSVILKKYRCVGFHLGYLPEDRGGSPLQYLIMRGEVDAPVHAFKMTEVLDGGPIYWSKSVNLSGSAHECYQRVADAMFIWMGNVMRDGLPMPRAQSHSDLPGRPRRNPGQSKLPVQGSPVDIWNHVRMLDAPTYPQAYVDHGEFRIYLSSARVMNGEVSCQAVIKRKP